MEAIHNYNERAETLEKSLIQLSVMSEGKVSLTEVYNMTFTQREMYIKLFNEYNDMKNKKGGFNI